MASSEAASEIVEELPLGHHSNGSRSSQLKFMLKADQRDGKSHVYPVDDELEKIIKEIHQKGVNVSQRIPSKKPVSGSTSRTSATATTSHLSLKQSLRRLCISQASEMAAMKRLSKQTGTSGVSEASTIKRLYASLVVQSNDSSLGHDHWKRVLVESSLVPERSTLNSFKKEDKELPSRRVAIASSSSIVMSGMEDVDVADLIKEGSNSSYAPGTDGKKRFNAKASMSMPSSRARTTRLTKSAIGNRASQSTKVKIGPTPSARCSDKSSGGNAVGSVDGERDLPVLEEPIPAATCIRTPIHTPHVKHVDDTVGKPGGSARSREKGECSGSSKGSLGDYSSSTSATDESNLSSSSARVNRPHMAKDVRWVAIQHAMLQHGSLGLKNFKLLNELGCGDIGIVYLAELIGSECLFALKVMNNDMLITRKKMLRAQTEKEILQMLDHPFLPTLYAHFVADNSSFLVMEYCPGGNLHNLRQRQRDRIFNEGAARFYVAEILLALEYLHMVGVVYRDLKPENILVRDDGHIMLSDFDLSLRCTVTPTLLRSSSLGSRDPIKKLIRRCSELSCMDPFCPHSSEGVQVSCFAPWLLSSRKSKHNLSFHFEPTDARSHSFVGTHEYLAPEIICGEGHGSAVDWWTLGIFLYELLYGKTPFKGAENEETLASIISRCVNFPEDPSVSFLAKDLIENLLKKDPAKRLGAVRGASEIKQHPFFEGLNWALIRCTTPPDVPKVCSSGNPLVMHWEKEGNFVDLEIKATGMEFEFF